MESIPDLVLGSVEDRTLAEVLDGTPVDFLKVLIHVKGPEFMLKFVKRFVPEYRLPTHYVSICQTCLHMHRDPIAMRVLREHAHELEAEVWPEFRELQKRLAGAYAALAESEDWLDGRADTGTYLMPDLPAEERSRLLARAS